MRVRVNHGYKSSTFMPQGRVDLGPWEAGAVVDVDVVLVEFVNRDSPGCLVPVELDGVAAEASGSRAPDADADDDTSDADAGDALEESSNRRAKAKRTRGSDDREGSESDAGAMSKADHQAVLKK